MAFPASSGALSDVLERACRVALSMKAQAQRARDRMAVGNVPSSTILDMDIVLRGFKTELQDAAATPGIVDYAQGQLGDGTLDVAAEFSAMIAGIDDTVAWIRASFPVGSGQAAGYLLARTWGADGPVDRQFTPTQTEGLRTQLDALIATVA